MTKQDIAKALVVSTMKDEAPYVLEWVAWYQTIGFDDFLIYTNDCVDGTDLILQRLEQLGIVKHQYNEVLRRGPHKSALKYAYAHPHYQRAEWVFVCDVDEFLNIHVGDGTLQDLLAHYPAADVIPVVWRLFSSGGHTEIAKPFITQAFTDAAPLENGGYVKTLFRRSDQVEKLGLHRPFFREDSQEVWAPSQPPENDTLRLVGNLGQDVAQLNHYAVRSEKSFLIKRARGRANHTSQTIGYDYWKRWNRGGETDQSIRRMSAQHEKAFAALLQDPILKALHDAAIELHQTRAQELLSLDPGSQELFALISETKPLAAETASPKPAAAMATDEEAAKIIADILETSDKARRAPNRRKLRQTMLDEVMPKGGRCAEIGVWEGDFSGEILNITKPRELVLIDPWDLLAEKSDEHTHNQHSSARLMRQKYDNVMGTLGRLKNCVVRKGFSAEVLATYPDDYFDWVYIDGNHMYDFVLQDILVSARKVRPGGIIAGDDLFWKRDDRMHVREAMREALRQLGNGFKQTKRGAQFIIHRLPT